jgi:hypothetical protein
MAVGGDSGGGLFGWCQKFCFILILNKAFLIFSDSSSVSYFKDDKEVFNKTVLDAIGGSFKVIIEGGNYTVCNSQGGNFNLELCFH